MCGGVAVWLVGVVSVSQASACHTDTTPTSHTETPTHIEICGHDTEHIYNDMYTGTRNVILAKHRL